MVGLNDWSARDIQAWEYVPLGPFLGKSFATSISHWVTPLAALDAAWVDLPGQDPRPLDYLDPDHARGLDIDVEVVLNGEVVSRPPYSSMYWGPAQMLAHLTVNGASLRTGDLFGSGTISGPERDQRGSFLELSWGGQEPLRRRPDVPRGRRRGGAALHRAGHRRRPDHARRGLRADRARAGLSPALRRQSPSHHGPFIGPREGRRVRIAQLANFIGPASGGMKHAVDALGRGYVEAGAERLLVIPGPVDAVTDDRVR